MAADHAEARSVRVALVNPGVVVQRGDPMTTGIVYMPVGLAHAAAHLRECGAEVAVMDAFGSAPRRFERSGKFNVHGLPPEETAAGVAPEAAVVFLYANQLLNHISLIGIVRALKTAMPGRPVVILENTQAVTAYALGPVSEELLSAGADYLLCGEPEAQAPALAAALAAGDQAALGAIPGLIGPGFSNPVGPPIADLDALPRPAWDLFPCTNYWGLRFAHGPQTDDRYLPLLTSRGCPYPCTFCVVPSTNDRRWRPRSPAHVVDEMQHFVETLGVREFHIEDLNPTIQDERTREICREILRRNLRVTWKLVAGTKVETIKDEETVALMAQAGCRYVSISPETGSPRILERIRKPFDLDHAKRTVEHMTRHGIRTQACFVLGMPGEEPSDRQLTENMVYDLVRGGVDEIALFIIAPVPGSKIFDEFSGYESLSDLNFTPTWRTDYEELSKFRLRLYGKFLWWKVRYRLPEVLWQACNFARRRFETKMEMVPYRALVWRFLDAIGR